MKGDENRSTGKLTRRQFLVGTGAIGAAMLLPGQLLAIPNGIPDAEGFLVVDLKKCQGCGICARECPAEAIKGGKRMVHVIEQDKCIKCGTCFDACPSKFNAVLKVSGVPVMAPT